MDVEHLRGLPPLEGVSEAGLERVAACAADLSREAGQVLALPDDPGSGMYVIREGTVAVELRTRKVWVTAAPVEFTTRRVSGAPVLPALVELEHVVAAQSAVSARTRFHAVVPVGVAVMVTAVAGGIVTL